MLENYMMSESQAPKPCDAFLSLSSYYTELISHLSVRAYNVLSTLLLSFSNEEDFFKYLLSMTPEKVIALKNCGRKTQEELLTVIS